MIGKSHGILLAVLRMPEQPLSYHSFIGVPSFSGLTNSKCHMEKQKVASATRTTAAKKGTRH